MSETRINNVELLVNDELERGFGWKWSWRGRGSVPGIAWRL